MAGRPTRLRTTEPTLLTRLRSATIRELAAQEALELRSSVIVATGFRVGRVEPRFRLVVGEPPTWIRRGARARLKLSGTGCFDVEVRRVGTSEVEVVAEQGFLGTLEGAELSLTGSELTAALARKLAELESGGARYPLADKALGDGSPLRRRVDTALDDALAFRLNEQQLASVAMALSYDVSWIWGPPGTGKTTTLAELIVERRRQGLSTLVVGPTNRAVDVLASRTLALMQDPSPGDVVRAGSHPSDEFDVDPAFLLSWQEKQRNTTAKAIVARASIVFCTADYLYMSQKCQCGFDGVVVDEAGLLPAPKLYVAAAAARTSLTLAGDFMQGRPISIARAPEYANDTFRAVGLPESVVREDRPDYMTQLEEQHRLPPDVRLWASELWYAGRLHDSPARRRRLPLRSHLGQSSLMLVDTSDIGGAATRDRNRSVSNEAHVGVVRSLLGYMMDSPIGEVEPVAGGVTIITPFSAQRRALLRAIPEPYLAAGVEVCSAYEVQGNETGTAILDLTVSSSTSRSGILASSSPDDIGSAAVVVGATRCTERLIVIADIGSMLRSGGAIAQRLCTTLREHAEEIDLAEIDAGLVGL